MGWSGGSSLLRSVWERVRQYVPEAAREDVLVGLMKDFSRRDCDTLAEVVRDDWPESERAYERVSGETLNGDPIEGHDEDDEDESEED